MIISKKIIPVILGMLLITPFLCGQTVPPPGVRLLVNPVDQFSRAFGVRDQDVDDAVRKGITKNGLRPDESSDLVVSVSIIPIAQHEEDRYPFRIEVHGGSEFDETAGNEFSRDVIGDIPAVKNLTVAWGDEDRILAAVRELAGNIAIELRKELRRRRSGRR
ncbi:MAG TPA: hypothetical protein VL633_13320 [Bacteroidota bacterium]|jgi:hypothetical protein|nr:hypothetical protein [Bacteroidota bacterium]